MKLTSLRERLSPYSTIILLVVPMLLLTAVADLLGGSLIVRIVTVLFCSLIVVLGLQLFMGNSGILAWAHVGFMGIGAYISVLCSMRPEVKAMAVPNAYPFLIQLHLPFWPSLLIGALAAGLVAALISYPLMRLSDAAAAITSFALLIILQVVMLHWDRVTNGPRTLFGVEEYTTLWVSALSAAGILVLVFLFKESSLGLKLRASREDYYAASSIGINITQVRYLSFIVSSTIAGFGGGLWAHHITSFTPNAFYLTETFNVLAMLVVGGPLGVSGAAVGTLAVTSAREGLRAIENTINLNHLMPFDVVGLTEVCLSIALVLILILRPKGILGGREFRWSAKKPQAARPEGSPELDPGSPGLVK
jgi:branched-chain amino acid transport system permease protein